MSSLEFRGANDTVALHSLSVKLQSGACTVEIVLTRLIFVARTYIYVHRGSDPRTMADLARGNSIVIRGSIVALTVLYAAAFHQRFDGEKYRNKT